jgi:vitamin B12 transporter
LDEAVITTNKYPKKQSETGKVITVITRQQLERSSGKTLGELLNATVGTTIIGSNNDLGTNQTVSIRGASAGNVLILVDGIPVNDPSVVSNYFDLNLFALDQIERIEILKGGQATLYGSDAVAGVINIITKKAGAKPFSMNAGFTAGSYSTFKQNIGFSGRKNDMNYGLYYSHTGSDGFSTAFDSTGNKDFDKDGFDQHVVNGKLGVKLTPHLQANLSGIYSYYKTDLDASAFTDEKDYTVKNKNAQGRIGFIYDRNHGSIHFNYQFNYVSRDYLDDSGYRSSPYVIYSKASYIGRTQFAELYSNWKQKQWEWLAGIDYRLNNTHQYYFSTGPFGPYAPPLLIAKANQVSPYASMIYKNETGFNIELAGRLNIHSEYGTNFTYTLNPFYMPGKTVKVFANLYSTFKAPTLFQLFDSLSGGNTDLKPEKGTIIETGVELFPCKSFDARIVGFYRDTRNAIVYTYNASTFMSKYLNADKEQNYGAELELNYTMKQWNLSANYTYTDGKLKSSFDNTGSALGKDTAYYNLYRIPKHAFNLTAGVQAGKQFYTSASIHAVSKREEGVYASIPRPLKGYATIALYSEYKFSQKIKLFIYLENITNKRYFDILGYNSKRFNGTIGILLQL